MLRNSTTVFLVGNIEPTIAWYERLGFESNYFPPGFAILRRDDVEIFLQHQPGSWVLLRPDDIIHDDDRLLLAEVENKAFRGAEFLYTLKLPSGQRALSLVPSHHNHAIGEKIGIKLAVDHVVAFRRG